MESPQNPQKKSYLRIALFITCILLIAGTVAFIVISRTRFSDYKKMSPEEIDQAFEEMQTIQIFEDPLLPEEIDQAFEEMPEPEFEQPMSQEEIDQAFRDMN